MAKQMAFYFDSRSCTGCKACQMACKDKNDLPLGVLWRRVYEVNGGEWLQRGAAWESSVFAYSISMACNHCIAPICKEVCPAAAITSRADGVVLIDENRCIGCRYCEWACPYSAPQFNETSGKMTKCNFCFDYLDQGLPPACVAACPLRVLEYGPLDELQAKYGNTGDIYPLPDPSVTKPNLVVTPHKDAVRARFQPANVGNSEEV